MATTTRSITASVCGWPSTISVILPASQPGTVPSATAKMRSRSGINLGPSSSHARLKAIKACWSSAGVSGIVSLADRLALSARPRQHSRTTPELRTRFLAALRRRVLRPHLG